MKVLCAGAGGFIGGHMVGRLLADGHEVRAVDIKLPDDWYQLHVGAENRVGDLSKIEECRRAVAGCDQVINLAADMGGMGFIESNKMACMYSVITSTFMLKAAFEGGVGRYAYASSACVYNADKQSDPGVVALRESDAFPAMAEPGYGWEKLFSELFCRYALDEGLETRVARYHNVFGTCYDEITEIMTHDGFKFFRDLVATDKVATRTATGDLEFHRPLAYQDLPYEGWMKRFQARSYDLLVTPDHAMAIVDRRTDTKLRRLAAAEVAASRAFLVRHAGWEGVEVGTFTIPAMEFIPSAPFQRRNRNGTVSTISLRRSKPARTVAMDDWLEFLGWYIAEGCCIKSKQGRTWDYIVDIRQFDHQNTMEIVSVIRRLGFHPSIQDGRVKVSSKALYLVLQPLGHAGEKYVPSYVRDLSSRQLKILLTAMIKGDGTFRRDRFYAYTTKSKRLCDHVTEIATKLGMAVTTSYRSADPERRVGATYNLGFSVHTVHKILESNVTDEWYQGRVYDVTVPNHVILVRRNGKTMWSGNCGTWDGGREKAPAAISRKVAQAKLSGDHRIQIWGDGEQTRSFCYIDDCVEGTLRLMASDVREPLNIGSSELVSINELVSIVEDIAGVTLERSYQLDAPQGVRGRNSDNQKIKELLGWEPSIPLRAGLEKTYQWVEEQVKEKGAW